MSKKKQAEFLQWFIPVIEALRELGGSGTPNEVCETISRKLKLEDSILEALLPSGIEKFKNQVQWARQYLVWEGYLSSSKRGIWTLTDKGFNIRNSDIDPREIFLKWVNIFQKARQGKESDSKSVENKIEEAIETGTVESKPADLLSVLQSLTPKGFENISKLLLREFGFENIQVIGGSYDDGIDGYGYIELNPFVSFKVLFQCKRYKNTVSREQVDAFIGTMLRYGAEKGIIITTGTFSESAKKAAVSDDSRKIEGKKYVELIDGQRIVELFEKAELGLKPKTVYEIDYSFFEPFMTQ
jgi:restriction system protein